ncbi:MAG: hypothetical protein R2784_01785 [Saprospiraceae bacterium]
MPRWDPIPDKQTMFTTPRTQSPVCHLFETLYPYNILQNKKTMDNNGNAVTNKILIIPNEAVRKADGRMKLAIG